ncbi:MAG TPA: adenylate/guanylate cyclase domain-containing protein [Aggregatilinea sp.]|jgi:adenylate cyclase|uniref:adenylate/guanylate cyclase domain-containing protein n=1 Tax=Aggregatilinea sp. TaxID=2806333 RepID=UPI002D15E087|nr:adenylate/guanylate cyclase domain-containing protein [Aggregatilinea sp.]HML24493.1 adenylate/guanylate cyclase domain-containing protein [Aggregatilinea sp.]
MSIPKILIAEDNRDSRELVGDILDSLGYTPIMAENGRAALDMIQSDPPDLVILDVNMPEIDGFEVCATIKRNPATAKIPVIMLTAQTDVDSRVIGLGLGADDYLPKPFHPRELAARIHARIRAKEVNDLLREQREQIQRTFERFVAPEIVEQLLDDPSRVQLGGAETIVTVLFADLEHFTTVSEHAAPTRLLEVLNGYLTLLVHCIKSHGGTVNKYLGDGIMALYNTPLPQEDHALRAVKTALDARAALPGYHAQLEPELRLAVNFGIHTGTAIVGNIGTPEQMDFTAVGDTVNLASRLEDLSDNGEITISQDSYKLVADQVIADCVGPRLVRGREEQVVTFLVQGLR